MWGFYDNIGAVSKVIYIEDIKAMTISHYKHSKDIVVHIDVEKLEKNPLE